MYLQGSIFMMGSLTPPWADELLSRNTKIARKMMSSMSTESYLLDQSSLTPSPPNHHRPNRFLSVPVANPSDPISPLPTSPTLENGITSKTTSNSSAGSFDNASKVVDPSSSTARMASSSRSPTTSLSQSSFRNSSNVPSSSSVNRFTRNTEKLSPIRNERDSMFVDNNDEDSIKKTSFNMTNGTGQGGGEDLSLIEYGPGIVKKLRSRYQSLALRQYTARPSLRRSASLENCLDAVSAEELAATLESKISNGNGHHHGEDNELVSNGRQTRPRNRFLPNNSEGRDSESRTESPAPVVVDGQPQQNGKGGGGPRGRASGHPDASARRDRMRRARSVDALHRTKREEEILEKFKHVVLPKEEIVIIEVSKPPRESVGVENGTFVNSNGLASTPSTGGAEKRFPTRLLLTSNNFRSSGLDQQTARSVVRNLMISPEHELPPHDIVRETARIFERNQENLNKRIGQALRLTKSQSASGGLGNQSPDNVAQPKVTAQSTTASPSAMQSAQDKQQGFTTASPSSQALAHGQKQIGIIKPTLSNGGSLLNSNAVKSGGGTVNGAPSASVENNRGRSPILSPIGYPNKPLLQHQNSLQKPPLSPKPIFTSSPKVPSTVASAQKGKNATAVSTGSVQEPSPATSPILIIENQRSLSPFKSESPVPRVKSPVSTINSEENAFMRPSSPLKNGKVSPPVLERLASQQNRAKSPEETTKEIVVVEKANNKTGTTTTNVTPGANLQNGQQQQPPLGSSDHHRQQVTKSGDQIPAPPPRTVSPSVTPPPTDSNSSSVSSSKSVSQLRVHQSKKSSQKGGNGSMVFNFTARKQVPDYIEDDGLRKASGHMGAEEQALLNSLDKDSTDAKVIPNFEGANIIINGKSSIQKRPKSQKLSISFNEEATTTHEYPSESSFAIEEEPSAENENHANPRKPSVISNSTALGSYTPKVGGTNNYQLGSYTTSAIDNSSTTGQSLKKKQAEEEQADFIEDYLKPNTESTTWSNEMSSDILF